MIAYTRTEGRLVRLERPEIRTGYDVYALLGAGTAGSLAGVLTLATLLGAR